MAKKIIPNTEPCAWCRKTALPKDATESPICDPCTGRINERRSDWITANNTEAERIDAPAERKRAA